VRRISRSASRGRHSSRDSDSGSNMHSAALIEGLERISRLVPKRIINRLIISPRSKMLVQMYTSLPKPERPTVYTISGGVSIEIDLSKSGERAISFDAFEPLVTERVLNLLRKGDVVMDVGSWIGYYTLIAAHKVGSKGRVVSIEPHAENFRRLVRNVELNGFSKNVITLNLAVGERKSHEVLAEGSDSLTHRVIAGGRTIGQMTSIDTVDNIIEASGVESIELVIMDIEGFEHCGLLGANRALAGGIIKNIICEIHPDKLKLNGSSEAELFAHLTKLGYKITRFTNMVNVYHVHVTR
jgi:FkbM family methyltransferase